MEKIIKDARNLALSKKSPPKILFKISEKKALELCEIFKEADKRIVHIGVCLMDIMLEEALRQGDISRHVEMSVKKTKEFLNEYDLNDEEKSKIVNCVEAHHKGVDFECIEAEICANADCYKFIHPRGVLYYFSLLSGERGGDFVECLDQVEYKLDEKKNILTLDYCKKELEGYYKNFKKYIKDSRNF